MRLLTHNMLHSAHKRGVQKGYPLNLEIEKTEIIKQEIDETFLKDRLPQLDWNCFVIGCKSVGINDIPLNYNGDLLNNKDFLAKCHHALLEIHVIDGNLICPESKRKFPITDGIPNMLLREDELPNINENDLRIIDQNEQKNDNNNDNDNNPYLDPMLMQGLEQFTPKENQQFIASHKVDSNKNDKDNEIVMKD
eukprot:416879_1